MKQTAAQVEMAKKAAAMAATSKKSSFKPKPSKADKKKPEQIAQPDSAVSRAVVSNLAGQPPPSEAETGKIYPDYFYRLSEGPKYFGYKMTVLMDKIASGEIPMPVQLSDSGRARGWFGWQILDWQRERVEKARNKSSQSKVEA